MAVNFEVISSSVIRVATIQWESNRPGSNAEAMALQRDKNENESIPGRVGLLKLAFWATVMTGGERVAHEGILPGLLIGGPLGADFRHSSGNARPFEAQ
jgi:hypothetical protein